MLQTSNRAQLFAGPGSAFFIFAICVGGLLGMSVRANADSFSFSTGDPDGRLAAGSRPGSGGQVEIESADDFILSNQTLISSATFTGLLSGASTANVGNVVVEIYRVFPADSDVGRTSGPPTFSTPQVPTRVNSPADVELDSRSFIQVPWF